MLQEGIRLNANESPFPISEACLKEVIEAVNTIELNGQYRRSAIHDSFRRSNHRWTHMSYSRGKCLQKDGKKIIHIAEQEHLDAHANAVKVRLHHE